MIMECEQCHKMKECSFYGKTADVDSNQSQVGAWLCAPCVPILNKKLDDATAALEAALEDDDES